jgi:hypothetical protein
MATAKQQGLTNPIKANAFIGAVIDQITIDPALKGQLLSLVSHYRNISPDAIPETTLPVTEVGARGGYRYNGAAIGDVDFPDQPADNQVIAAWDRDALPTPTAPTVLNVDNISGTPPAASRAAGVLRAAGFHIGSVTSTEEPATTTETLVEYGGPTDLAQAVDVFDHLSGAVMLQSVTNLPAGTVTVAIGNTVAVTSPAAATPGSGSTGSATTAPAAAAVPTPGGQTASASSDVQQKWDPLPCASS